MYFGSVRGQERELAERHGFAFEAFDSAPLYSLKTPRGWRSLAALLRSSMGAKPVLLRAQADMVFSTGGYSAAPVMSAARATGTPYVIHEANSVPGRANRLFSAKAKAITHSFRSTAAHLAWAVLHRTGQPIRPDLRQAVGERLSGPPTVLAMGGSQGSKFLNELVPLAAAKCPQAQFILVTGRANSAEVRPVSQNLEVAAYLDTPALAQVYRRATVVIARSGSSVAEFAMARIPSLLIPLPSSADDHQYWNACEFADMHAATVFREASHGGPAQPRSIADPDTIADSVCRWITDQAARELAARNLAEWDDPDATQKIVDLLESEAS